LSLKSNIWLHKSQQKLKDLNISNIKKCSEKSTEESLDKIRLIEK